MSTTAYRLAGMLAFSLVCFPVIGTGEIPTESRDASVSKSAGHKKEPVKKPPLTGRASWYPGKGKASVATAAHRSFPFGTYVRVTNLSNNKNVVVRINDRGPYIKGRIIDVNRQAAKELGMLRAGTVKVRLEVVPKPDA